ncbi:MAG: DUF4238 domain-containing protein [Candidatus Aenigmarchaeota archaeon]|nr:DUF4238 domain-containing protein [Candidatus Aenigmarchaeota archaeon]
MPAGNRQHLIPQMMIKKFTGEDDKVIELHKPSFRICTRRRSPRRILYIDNYYLDLVSNLDSDLLIPIEQNFARYYPSIVDHGNTRELSGEGGAALVDWVAAMLCRTNAFICIAKAIAQRENETLDALVSLLANEFRSNWFTEWQDILTRADFRWKMKVFPDECYIVITDNPVCQTNGLLRGGTVLMVPLSKHHIIFGGRQEATERCRNLTLGQVNTFLAAWADKSIFAADRDTLEYVKLNLEGNGTIGTEQWCEAARKPFFGCSDRIQITQFPSQQDLSTWWEQLKSSYGDSLLE